MTVRWARRSLVLLAALVLFLTALAVARPARAIEDVASDAPRPSTASPEAPEPRGTGAAARTGLHWIDGVIVAVYACGMLALGWYYNRTQTSTDEYFVGNRAMNPLLIGVSIFATLFSTISYLSTPGEIIKHGPVIPLVGLMSVPISYYVVGHLLVPAYMRHRVTTAYELLEVKLGVSVRLTGAAMFIVHRLTWMATMIYFTSSAMMAMLGFDARWLPVVSFATGCVAISYASLGGLRAVVITDLIQFLLLFGGAVLVIVTVTHRLDGLAWFPTSWNERWDTQPVFSIDPAVRVTMFGSIISGTLWWVCTAGGDQTAIQRFMATGDAQAARRSFLINSIAGAMVSVVLTLVGFALLGYFQSQPELLPAGMDLDASTDRLLPHYVSYHLPVGLSGLVVSGLFAAAMSSLDSGVNSITAVVMTDFVDRFKRRPMTQRGHVLAAKSLAFAIGLIVVVIASVVMPHVPGNFLEITKRTIELFISPIFVLFCMALFVPFATSAGTIVGALSAFAAALLVGYWHIVTGRWAGDYPWLDSAHVPQSFSFQWITAVSLATGLLVGCVASLLFGGLSRRRI